jgi:hypothetical protein
METNIERLGCGFFAFLMIVRFMTWACKTLEWYRDKIWACKTWKGIGTRSGHVKPGRV